MNQEGNDQDVLIKRGLDLYSDKVTRILQTVFLFRSGSIQPSVPDHDQKDLAPADCFFEMLLEIDPQWNRIHILEDCRSTKMPGQPIIDAARDIGTVRPAVGNKNIECTRSVGFCWSLV